MSEVEEWTPDAVGQRVYHLRKTGLAWHRVVEELEQVGVSLSLSRVVGVYRDYMKSITQAWGPNEREAHLAMELERLDELQFGLWQQAMIGDTKSVDTLLRLMAQRQKLLGLDVLQSTDKQVINTLLVVGEDQKTFVEALTNGRDSAQVGGRVTRPDDDDGEEEEPND